MLGSAYGSGGWGFESLRACPRNPCVSWGFVACRARWSAVCWVLGAILGSQVHLQGFSLTIPSQVPEKLPRRASPLDPALHRRDQAFVGCHQASYDAPHRSGRLAHRGERIYEAPSGLDAALGCFSHRDHGPEHCVCCLSLSSGVSSPDRIRSNIHSSPLSMLRARNVCSSTSCSVRAAMGSRPWAKRIATAKRPLLPPLRASLASISAVPLRAVSPIS
ncbi:hypothetical protein BH23ACT4_BH23ACT4_11430 [soil metagenome]